MKKDLKKFVVKKYIMASSAREAIRKEKHISPDDVWIDEDWRKANETKVESKTGF